jgi:superfamily II DNA or RNA helicase
MMQIKISNHIEIREADIPYLIIKRIKNDLSIKNPEYQQCLKFGYSTDGKPEIIKLFSIKDGVLILPRGYGGVLIQYLRDSSGTKFSLIDNRLTLPEVDFGSKIELRGYQEAAVSALVQCKQGGVCAPCGSGKTIIMLESMARIRQPALWITHSKELAEQAIERACDALNLLRTEIGVIGDGKFSIGDRLTVGLIQTLAKADINEFSERFGSIFVDEAHHLAAKSFYYTIDQFPSMYRIWASATPERSDGLTKMVFAAAGRIVHTIDQSQVPTIIPRLEVIETDYQGFTDNAYTKIISDLIKNKSRNQLIVDTVVRESAGNYSLVLSDRVDHLDILKRMLTKTLPKLRIEILTGSMKKKDRSDVMGRVNNRQVDILLATQLAREGLDIKHLNRLFLATPKQSGSAVQQEVGRVMRPEIGKNDAIVFDFWDVENPILKSQFWKRREVYRKIGMVSKDWTPSSRQVKQA